MHLLYNRWLHRAVNFLTQGQRLYRDVTQSVRRMGRGEMEEGEVKDECAPRSVSARL